MNKHNILMEIKLAVTGIFAAITAFLGALAVPFYILVILNVADYATGIFAAPYRGQKRSSAVGFLGIAKKICMWGLVGLGAVLDWLLSFAVAQIGITLPFSYLVGIVVAIWLICNEIVSILENMGDIGVDLPPFLMTLVKWVQSTAEDKVKMGEDKDHA